MNKDEICNFANKLIDMINETCEYLPAYEVGHYFIMMGVDLLLTVAPDERLAWKTIMASVESGIKYNEKKGKGLNEREQEIE